MRCRLDRRVAVLFLGLCSLLTVGANAQAGEVEADPAVPERPCSHPACRDTNAALDSSTQVVQVVPVGHATRSLMQLQASGVHASSHAYPVPGAVASKVYERYVNSFGHPIAEKSATTLSQGSR